MLDQRIAAISTEIQELARADDGAVRLMSVPGIGPIISTATVAGIGEGDVFGKGRDFSAWLGLVQRAAGPYIRVMTRHADGLVATARGECEPWHGAMHLVRSFRHHHEIAVYRPGEWAERGEITLEAAAWVIGVTPMTALRMIRRGDLKGRQLCRGAPWVIRTEDVAIFGGEKRASRSLTANPAQRSFDLQ